ncbi:MAG: hypothetical protein CVT92_10650 [Bacteroidetes bacterium HGW-Bacteroidetes-1]|nr:MAG: hypothetical protein CVT92_10650 [Bacteroidetes bacterium HGW-Bacteroidetes-1]
MWEVMDGFSACRNQLFRGLFINAIDSFFSQDFPLPNSPKKSVWAVLNFGSTIEIFQQLSLSSIAIILISLF